MNPIKKTIELPDGRTITLETGKLAKQADGAVELGNCRGKVDGALGLRGGMSGFRRRSRGLHV